MTQLLTPSCDQGVCSEHVSRRGHDERFTLIKGYFMWHQRNACITSLALKSSLGFHPDTPVHYHHFLRFPAYLSVIPALSLFTTCSLKPTCHLSSNSRSPILSLYLAILPSFYFQRDFIIIFCFNFHRF